MTSTSTPGSKEIEVCAGADASAHDEKRERKRGLTICLTTSEDECKSINRLWIRISYLSQVLEPSPQGLEEGTRVSERERAQGEHGKGKAGGYLRLSGGDLQDLGGHSNGTLDTDIPVLGSGDQVTADYAGHQPLYTFQATGVRWTHTSPSWQRSSKSR